MKHVKKYFEYNSKTYLNSLKLLVSCDDVIFSCSHEEFIESWNELRMEIARLEALKEKFNSKN